MIRKFILGAFGSVAALVGFVFAEVFLNISKEVWLDFSFPPDHIPFAMAAMGGFLLQVFTFMWHPEIFEYGLDYGRNRQIVSKVFLVTVILGGGTLLGFRFFGVWGYLPAAAVSLVIYPWRR